MVRVGLDKELGVAKVETEEKRHLKRMELINLVVAGIFFIQRAKDQRKPVAPKVDSPRRGRNSPKRPKRERQKQNKKAKKRKKN